MIYSREPDRQSHPGRAGYRVGHLGRLVLVLLFGSAGCTLEPPSAVVVNEKNDSTPSGGKDEPRDGGSDTVELMPVPERRRDAKVDDESSSLRLLGDDTPPALESLGKSGRFPQLPIPVRFVGMADYALDVTQFAAGDDFDGCPRGVAYDTEGRQTEQVVWSDCVALAAVEHLNAEMQSVLGTTETVFESLGFFLADGPEYTVVRSRQQEEEQLAELSGFALAIGGVLSVSISNWTHRAGGYAGIDRPLDETDGAVIMLSQGADKNVLVHEFGHIMGAVHLDEDLPEDGMIRYDACGPISAPGVASCDCEFNVMQSERGVAACPDCAPREQTFLTSEQADFFRAMADCWFSRRRFAGLLETCSFAELQMDCHGYRNDALFCDCPGGEARMVLDACHPLDSAAEAVFFESCSESSCLYREAYPGVRCTTRAGNTQCQCMDDGTMFSAPGCGLEPVDVFDACLSQPAKAVCPLSFDGERVECVVQQDDTLACICTESGRLFAAPAGAECKDLDLDSVRRNCRD